MRIVSLLPSATETVCALGLAEQLVGVSHECDYPAQVQSLPAVTVAAIRNDLPSAEIDRLVREQLRTEQALYRLRMDVLEDLRPDLIVTQALCEVCAVAATEVEAAARALPGNPRVINLEPMSLGDVLDTIDLLGAATDRIGAAAQVRAALQGRVDAVVERSGHLGAADRRRVGFLEWIDPLFNAGHWTPELIAMAGGVDCLGSVHQPSRRLQPEELVAAAPDVLFVAQCGFDGERTRQDLPLLRSIEHWEVLPCVRQGRLYYTDGNAYFSRPGPRLVDSLEIMAHALYPQLHPLPAGLPAARTFAAQG